jgi:glycosyltransferase involved in cell wall biosynthesis
MKILYVGTLPPHPDGSAVACWQLLRGLAGRGYLVRGLGPRSGKPPPVDPLSADGRLRITPFLVEQPLTSPDRPPSERYRAQERGAIERLVPELIERDRPDIALIGRESFAWYIPLVVDAELPCVMQAHGTLTAGIVDGTYPQEEAERLLRCVRQANAVQVPAQHLARTLESLGVRNVEVIRNGVDLELFRPRSRDTDLSQTLRLAADDVVVAHFSNLKRLKRPMDVVESAEIALRRDARLLYVVVGDGAARADMERACAQKGISHRFRFVGWVDHATVPRYLSLADVVVMPSESEAQALIYLEAQASACTLVASDVPGARTVVVDRETGLLCRVGDARDLAEKTLLAASSPELRAEIGRAARDRVLSHSVKEIVEAHARLLERVVTETPARTV